MPVQALMGWVASLRRWQKSYKGQLYVVSARQLGMPLTKEQSVIAANLWWEAKLSELNRHPDIKRLNAEQEALESLLQNVRRAKVEMEQPIVAPERTLRERFASWLSSTEAAGQTDRRRLIAAQDHHRRVLPFVEWTEKQGYLDITAPTLEGYYVHLCGMKLSPMTLRSRWANVCSFVQYCIEQGMAAPTNFRSRRFKFSSPSNTPKSWTVEQIREALGITTISYHNPTTCFLLLMLNCGYYQQDISDLRKEDLKDGIITRCRSKTRTTSAVFFLLMFAPV